MIQEYIKKPLAEELLFGKLAKGGVVRVTIKDGKPSFRYPEGKTRRLPPPQKADDREKEPVE